jgi:hypothetical protein
MVPRYLPFSAISDSPIAKTLIKGEMASTGIRRWSRHSSGLSPTSHISGSRCFGVFVVLQSKLRAASGDSRPCPTLGSVYMFSYMEDKVVVVVVVVLLLPYANRCVRSPTPPPKAFLGPGAPLHLSILHLGLLAASQLLHQPEHVDGKVHGPRYQADGLKCRQRHAVPPHF